ncbi:MAG TPA: hypothetical protein PLD59_07955 [Tepidisphaeraceae bacterium]|nr:hypothetical protein [Tepidisphaeraceae bacterium]
MSTAAPARQGTYEFGKPLGKCAISGADISPGDKFMAALRESPLGFERLDIATAAWDDFAKDGLVAFWQAVMPEPNKVKKLFVDDTVLCELFERLSDVQEPPKVSFRFVLGLILMRKRLLSYETSRHDQNHDVWTVKLKGRDKPCEMIDPRLTEDQLGEVTQQIGQILNSEL